MTDQQQPEDRKDTFDVGELPLPHDQPEIRPTGFCPLCGASLALMDGSDQLYCPEGCLPY